MVWRSRRRRSPRRHPGGRFERSRHALCWCAERAAVAAPHFSIGSTSKEIAMTLKTLIAAAVAAAFAWPLAAGAAGDKPSASSAGSDKASAGASSSASAGKDDKASGGATKDDGGAEAMFKALDKDKDGSISKEEAKGTPHDKDFAKLDKNGDGKLSREEHAAAPEHASKAKAGSAGATGSTGASGSSGAATPAPSSGSKPKY